MYTQVNSLKALMLLGQCNCKGEVVIHLYTFQISLEAYLHLNKDL